jgi:hypothetical protein
MIWISRKFWGIIIPFIILGICQFFPSFHLDGEAATGLIVVVAGYVLSVAVDPGANAGTWFGVFASRKFWAALVGLTVMFLDGFGLKLPASLPPNSLIDIGALICAYMGGVAIEGVKKPPIDLKFKDTVSTETGDRSGGIIKP